MKNIFLLSLSAMSMMFAEAQNIYYNGSINHNNFRSEPSFLEEIEMGNIDYERANACLFYATNEQRAKHNKPIAKNMDAMESAAWHHSKLMIEQSFFSHVNPSDPNRKNVSDRLRLVGLSGSLGGENIASGNGGGKSYLQLADDLINRWLNSPGHRAGMLQDNEVYLGTGIYLNPMTLICNATQVFTQGNPQVKPNEIVDHYSNISKAGKYEIKIADEHFIFSNGTSMRKVDILGNTFWQECDKNNKPFWGFTELRRTSTHLFLLKKGTNMHARLALGAGAFQIAYTENPQESEWSTLTGSQYSASKLDKNPNPKETKKIVADNIEENNPVVKESYTTENGTVFQKIVTSNGEAWQEVNANGKVAFTFKEYIRVENHVDIIKDGTNMTLRIPLTGSGWVQIGYQNQPEVWTNLYKLKEN